MGESLFRLICAFIIVTEHARMTSAMLYASLIRRELRCANRDQKREEKGVVSISSAALIGYGA